MRFLSSAGIIGIVLGVVSGCGGGYANRATESLHISPNVYVAQVGDTVNAVAYRYRLSANNLYSLNPGLGSELRPGDHIIVRAPVSNDRRNRQPVATREIPARYRPPGSRQRAPGEVVVNERTQARERTRRDGRSEVVVSAIPPNVKPLRENKVIEEIIADVPVVDNTAERIIQNSEAPANFKMPSRNGWQWPVKGEIVREYAPSEVNGQGIDIAGLPGQPVMASAAGTVIYAARDLSDSGNLVIIRHSEDVLSTYSHVKDLYVAEDDTVGAGDHLASLGWNSNRESVLHFEIRKDGRPMDPLSFLPNR